MPRAPVIAFQPAIAAAREASGVWSLMTAAIPTSIEAPATPPATAATHRTRRPAPRRTRQPRPADQAAEAHRGERARTIGDRAPDEEGHRRRDGGQHADDADIGQRQVEPVDVDQGEQRPAAIRPPP